MKNKIFSFLMIAGMITVSYFIFDKVALLKKGGPVMILIIFSSMAGVSVVIDKFLQLAKESSDIDRFLDRIFELLERLRIKEAMDLCDQKQTALSRILKSGIMKYDQPKEEIKEAMEASLLQEVPYLESRLGILSTIAQVAPLLGFVGTIFGLIEIFQFIEVNQVLATGAFASGLWRAFICSVTGFSVAIPCLVASNYFKQSFDTVILSIERTSMSLAGFLIERRRRP